MINLETFFTQTHYKKNKKQMMFIKPLSLWGHLVTPSNGGKNKSEFYCL